MPGAFHRQRRTLDIWPGFVDALAALLMIIIFLVLIFTLAQFFLSQALSGRNQALERLTRQVDELAQMLSLEQAASAGLRENLARMSADLETAVADNDRLSNRLAEVMPQSDALEAQLAETVRERDLLRARLDERTAAAAETAAELEEARELIKADKETIALQLRQVVQLNRDIVALRKVREDLEKRVADMASTLAERNRTVTALRNRAAELEARLSTERERTALAQKEVEEKTLTVRELSAQTRRIGEELTDEQQENLRARREIELLNRNLAVLRQQLARLNAALEASEAKASEQEIKIVSLGKRLNEALASKVAELARYRSEFFGRLREVLGAHREIRIEGDRFVFQSEVLFSSGSADLNPGGRQQIDRLGDTLIEISRRIPKDLNWVLRVDGHTDRIPIKTPLFASNWELSAARAISVVKQLLEKGIPATRLVAAGFGQFQPLDDGETVEAFRRNRRIEFKLTQR